MKKLEEKKYAVMSPLDFMQSCQGGETPFQPDELRKLAGHEKCPQRLNPFLHQAAVILDEMRGLETGGKLTEDVQSLDAGNSKALNMKSVLEKSENFRETLRQELLALQELDLCDGAWELACASLRDEMENSEKRVMRMNRKIYNQVLLLPPEKVTA